MFFLVEIIIWYALLWIAAQWGRREGLITYVVSAAIIANIETTQFITLFGLTMPGGIIPFACLFLATDIASERYGRSFSHGLVLYAGVGMLISSLIIALFGLNTGVSEAYHDALRATVRIAFASISVYYLCGWLDVLLYHRIGQLCRFKWLRNNVATITSQFINATCFIILAFGWVGWDPILGNWLVSSVLALIDTPVLYWITGKDRVLEK